MKAQLEINKKTYNIDLSEPLDISIGLRGDHRNPIAWYLKPPEINAVRDGGFVGKVSEGASVNFNNIQFNPHAHGTHTECVGHISAEFFSINQVLTQFFFQAKLISVTPKKEGEDLVISEDILRKHFQKENSEALIIRTLPNPKEKKEQNHSHTNWPYLSEAAATYIRNSGIKHLLIDLPSVDKEKDDGKLLAHKAFWDYPKNTRQDATITEFIYVPDIITDGDYLLNIQIASFENDATPSKPILYKITEE